jgi:hypothetical protein
MQSTIIDGHRLAAIYCVDTSAGTTAIRFEHGELERGRPAVALPPRRNGSNCGCQSGGPGVIEVDALAPGGGELLAEHSRWSHTAACCGVRGRSTFYVALLAPLPGLPTAA